MSILNIERQKHLTYIWLICVCREGGGCLGGELVWAVFRISRVESSSPHQTMEAALGVMYSILLLIFSNILQELN